MLKLKNITKDYSSSDETVHALKGINVSFRNQEFVSILGPSGCGKTTLLNIIGGLDRYSDGDLIIEGKSTKDYDDATWDTYRNHRIGFVFQSYNLIGHISVRKNIELALTISGVKKDLRKKLALDALSKVGLSDKANKKPNQLSGGQQQRVAIARALVNDPEIILADEPTGALDSETSIQVMEILKEASKNRLVIMVTHNPALAKKYSSRIITMKDGLLESDSNPIKEKEKDKKKDDLPPISDLELKLDSEAEKKSQMSFKTAFSLSLTNLFSKKIRTALVALGGSIGIIGIAVVLSISHGFDGYIDRVESNAMSTYPVSIHENAPIDFTVMMNPGSGHENDTPYPEDGKVNENKIMTDMLVDMTKNEKNDTVKFKEYLESDEIENKLKGQINDIQYAYDQALNIYKIDTLSDDPNAKEAPKYSKLAPLNDEKSIIKEANEYKSKETLTKSQSDFYNNVLDSLRNTLDTYLYTTNISSFKELLDNKPLLQNQYDVLEGRMPKKKNEVVLQVDKYNSINDIYLYALGLKDMSYYFSNLGYELSKSAGPLLKLPVPESEPEFNHNLKDFIGYKFAVVWNNQYYEKNASGLFYSSIEDNEAKLHEMIDNTLQLEIVGVVRPKKSVDATSLNAPIGYSPDLYSYLSKQAKNPTALEFKPYTILKDQKANPNIDMVSGLPIGKEKYYQNIKDFGEVDEKHPSAIYIFPSSFEGKQVVNDVIDMYNKDHAKKIKIVDNVSLMIGSVKTIIDGITYILIAFVAVSLVVSSIMIGIITYVSVLERTKEIGVLRSLGARKKDIRNVFNAETFITGLIAGVLGVIVAAICDIPIMFIINHYTNLGLFIMIPWLGIIVLPVISVILTVIAGLIPSSIAAHKDPVIALRSE